MLISFLMVLPVLYGAVRTGIQSADPQLLEMTKVFRLPLGRRLRAVWLPAVLPAFRQGCSVALGICWKSGVAAEVIGLPNGSIGDALYRAKITLSTGELFAWTFVIILLSAGFEKLFLLLLDCVTRAVTGGGAAMLTIEHLTKQFGENAVPRSLPHGGRPGGAVGTQRLGQDHIAAHPHGAGRTHFWHSTGRWPGGSSVSGRQTFCPQLTAVQNVTLVLPGSAEQYKGANHKRFSTAWHGCCRTGPACRTAFRWTRSDARLCCGL